MEKRAEAAAEVPQRGRTNWLNQRHPLKRKGRGERKRANCLRQTQAQVDVNLHFIIDTKKINNLTCRSAGANSWGSRVPFEVLEMIFAFAVPVEEAFPALAYRIDRSFTHLKALS